MTSLIQHLLNFDEALEYYKDNLEETNELSSKILKKTSFNSGRFFTYLPKNTEAKNLSLFSQGGIAIGVRSQVTKIIANIMHLNKNLSCIFDDITTSFNNNLAYPLFDSLGLSYGDEVYYHLDNKQATIPKITECLRASNAIWHSLCVMTTSTLNDLINKKLSDKKLTEICHNTKIIIVGAYDGEGYLFWEKKEPQ